MLPGETKACWLCKHGIRFIATLNQKTYKKMKVLPGFEPGLLDSESNVIAATLQNQVE